VNLDATLEELRQKHRSGSLYEVYCNNRRWRDRVITGGLPWDNAQQLAANLQHRHNVRHPRLTCWTKRHYSVRLQQTKGTMQKEHDCLRCGHHWYSRRWWSEGNQPLPKRCAKCRSPLWNTPFQRGGWKDRAKRRGVPVEELLTARSANEKESAPTRRAKTSHWDLPGVVTRGGEKFRP
jgi:hypothetical protein